MSIFGSDCEDRGGPFMHINNEHELPLEMRVQNDTETQFRFRFIYTYKIIRFFTYLITL